MGNGKDASATATDRDRDRDRAGTYTAFRVYNSGNISFRINTSIYLVYVSEGSELIGGSYGVDQTDDTGEGCSGQSSRRISPIQAVDVAVVVLIKTLCVRFK